MHTNHRAVRQSDNVGSGGGSSCVNKQSLRIFLSALWCNKTTHKRKRSCDKNNGPRFVDVDWSARSPCLSNLDFFLVDKLITAYININNKQ